MGHFNTSRKSGYTVSSDCLGYQVYLGDIVNIEEGFNVLSREQRPSHALIDI